MRYSDFLQRFNFILKWRPGNACERPDTHSRRYQDKPRGISDERTNRRILQLLPTVSVSPAKIVQDANPISPQNDPAATANLFEGNELQLLWEREIKTG